MRLSRLYAHRHNRRTPLLTAPSRWLRCLPRTRTISSETLLSPSSSPSLRTRTATSGQVRRRLSLAKQSPNISAFFSPSSSPAKSPRCPLPLPSSASSGRATPANNESPATPRRPSNRLRLPASTDQTFAGSGSDSHRRSENPESDYSGSSAATGPGKLSAHSLRGFGRPLPGDRVKEARAGPFLSNLASDKSQQYVIPFITLLRS
jgi:hypothetical protein